MHEYLTNDTVYQCVSTLQYLKSMWDISGTIDAMNMEKVERAIALIEADGRKNETPRLGQIFKAAAEY